MKNKKIVILGTGGTIAGTASEVGDNLGYTAAQLGIEQLVAALPRQGDLPFTHVTEQVAQLDSKDMDFGVWGQLASRVTHWLGQSDVQGIVITHGTDTLEETAWFLQTLLNPEKPVVLTCAMRPATALTPDGPQNMVDAIAVARHVGARGVMVVCAGFIHGAQDVQKVHTYRLDAFASGDAGPLGYVEEGRLRLVRGWPLGVDQAGRTPVNIGKLTDAASWPRVEIIMSHVGAGAAMVEALVADGVNGLVVAGTGNGTLHHALESALLHAQIKGVRIVRSTRCLNGRVIPGACDVLPDSQGLSPVKTRVSLLLSLMG
ncbi:MAG: asparaginase [Pseudomonadota bacterium]